MKEQIRCWISVGDHVHTKDFDLPPNWKNMRSAERDETANILLNELFKNAVQSGSEVVVKVGGPKAKDN